MCATCYCLIHRIRDISQNGVFLNSRKIPANQPVKLSDGDLIRIGYQEFRADLTKAAQQASLLLKKEEAEALLKNLQL
jgi:predicted component of type VI protein secretion system